MKFSSINNLQPIKLSSKSITKTDGFEKKIEKNFQTHTNFNNLTLPKLPYNIKKMKKLENIYSNTHTNSLRLIYAPTQSGILIDKSNE